MLAAARLRPGTGATTSLLRPIAATLSRAGAGNRHVESRRTPMRHLHRALLLVGALRCAAWTADGYPECTPAPACYPNRRAPDRGSRLNALFNKWCSDKGTYWLSKHGYGSAYDVTLGPYRRQARHVLEIGVGDETAGSLNAWREYFPRAHFWILDFDRQRFHDAKQFAWASRQKRRHGCFDDRDVWRDPRVHSFFGVDSSNATALLALPLPASIDIIIDDASHVLAHQVNALETLWPRLADGGTYIVEDVTVGALPWLKGAAAADQEARVPSNNSGCGHECHYPQRPAEHPFLRRLVPEVAERQAAQRALSLRARMPPPVEAILDSNPWHWAATGAHKGGGLDSTVIIQKAPLREPPEPSLGPGDGGGPASTAAAAAAAAEKAEAEAEAAAERVALAAAEEAEAEAIATAALVARRDREAVRRHADGEWAARIAVLVFAACAVVLVLLPRSWLRRYCCCCYRDDKRQGYRLVPR